MIKFLNKYVKKNPFLVVLLTTAFSGFAFGILSFCDSHVNLPKKPDRIIVNQESSSESSKSETTQIGVNTGTISINQNEKIFTKLSLVDLHINENNLLDLKFKNSGTDSVFIKGIEFIITNATFAGCGTPDCDKMQIYGTLYDYAFEIEAHGSEGIITTKKQPILRVSQVVPPKGVDRIQVQMTLTNAKAEFGYPYSYIFEGFAIIHFDENNQLKTPNFTIIF